MSASPSSKPTILVVDDSRLMRVAARKILKNEFEILEAEDGEAAWELVQENIHVDLLMSDLSMPNLDGLGLLKKIRESSDTRIKDIPVIIVTGAEDDDGSKNEALGAGASDFITKPFESVQLLARAQAQARQQRTQQALKNTEATKQELQKNSAIDALTGLGNQKVFHERFVENLAYAIRHQTELALLSIQIDRYKVLFLRRGKQFAEDLLCQVAHRISEGRRREDTVARIGLDRFGILLPSAKHNGAGQVAEQLRDAIDKHTFLIDDEPLTITISVAVTIPALQDESNVERWLYDGDEKLKAATKQGGNRVIDDLRGAAQVTIAPQTAVPAVGSKSTPLPIARSSEVQQALEALSRGSSPETSLDALARAVLPLLRAWDHSHDGHCKALLNNLQGVLHPAVEKTRASVCAATAGEPSTVGS